jgi:hypothetical protein
MRARVAAAPGGHLPGPSGNSGDDRQGGRGARRAPRQAMFRTGASERTHNFDPAVLLTDAQRSPAQPRRT